MGHVFETTEEKAGKIYYYLGVGSILMAVLKIAKPLIYSKLGTQTLKAQDAVAFFKELFDERNVEWWFLLCLTGGGISQKDESSYPFNAEGINSILREVGLLDEEVDSSRILSSFSSGWGRFGTTGRFKQIRTNIDEVTSWN